MVQATGNDVPRQTPAIPYHVVHASFLEAGAERLYGPETVAAEPSAASYMLDEVTRDLARRMHYAAWRMEQATSGAARRNWHAVYLRFRDRVILGNHKLIYRAVQRWGPPAWCCDDLVGDCQIVLMQAVAAYNPWLGIRFSTYAFTCLMRALSRLSQRHAADRLARSLPLESLPDGEPRDALSEDESHKGSGLDVYLREGNDLLSPRERRVLVRRFRLDEQPGSTTLEAVGRELGLSKERVRQVQASALGKLRQAMQAQGCAG